MQGDPSPPGAAPKSRRGRILDPVSRASEILFGLIMVLTFTTTLSVSGAGRDDVNVMLIGALGCGIAWAIIDAIMYLMASLGEKALDLRAVRDVQNAPDHGAAQGIIADALPPPVAEALAPEHYERIRRHLVALPAAERRVRLDREDWLGAIGVFLLVFLGTFPVVLPFMLIADPADALRASHIVAVTLLFLTGYAFGRQTGQPWRLGAAMVVIGLVLVAVAVALGG
jgi:VIT1/CCC1 family predicted Fe2+/Mn2+ transporter